MKKINIIVALSIIIFTIVVSLYWLKNRPKAHKKAQQKEPIEVTVQRLQTIDYQQNIRIQGLVQPATEINISSQVGGVITDIHPNFYQGGRIAKDESIIKIEKRDYEIQVIQQKAAVAKARLDYEQEKGRQKIAKREYKLLEKNLTKKQKKLVLRTPHLSSSLANLRSAIGGLELAELNLTRTDIKAPFDLVISQIYTNKGANLRNLDKVAKVYATKNFHIKSNITNEQYKQLDLENIRAKISYTDDDKYKNATNITLIGVSPVLNSSTKLIQLIFKITDPLNLRGDKKAKIFFVDDLVNVYLTGKTLKKVYRIKSSWIKNNNKIHVLTKNNTLEIVKIKVLALDNNDSIITAKKPLHNEQIITSFLSTPVENMKILAQKQKK
jgi:multidrug efflux pump subunit AcrA (membrane-fusion protein)